MKKSVLVISLLALATVHAASIPPSTQARHLAHVNPSSDVIEDVATQGHPYDTDTYISDDNIPDVVRSRRQYGGFGFGGSGSQAAANSFGAGYGVGGYPGGFGGSTFGTPAAFLGGGGGGFGGLGGYGGLGAGFSGSSAQSSSTAFGAGGGYWG